MSPSHAIGLSQQVVGFVGLGNMGAPMAGRLVAAGYDVVVFDLRSEAVDALVSSGARSATSAADVAAQSDLLLTSLPRPDHVEQVMRAQGALAALRPGSLWADLTTNRGDLIEALASEAPAGVSIVDSPVTGAVDGARTGKLTLFVGGAADDLDRAEPVLAHLGRVIRCGPRGTGNVVKLVTNQLWFIHAAAIGEGFALGMQQGVDLSVLWEAIKDSVGDSFVARHDAPSIFAGHYDPSFSLDLCLKDLGLIDELAATGTAPMPMTQAAHAVFADAAQRYGRDEAELLVAKRIEDDGQLSFRLDGPWVPHWEA